ncbi:thermonuclease family protein [Microbacterium sp. CJ88]|uniref:thermonuclease family protein n=1 Tax=Microbacterium sp. CJ88 TaxID=3445672 RepID=UPI003F65C524
MRSMTRWMPVVAVAAVIALAGCTPQPGAASSGVASNRAGVGEGSATATLVAVVDGDTIETSAGTVRIIGIDTPERGECGHDEASAALTSAVAPGDAVTLTLPAGENDTDDYGRLIRYVVTAGGVDLGMLQLQAGNAVARYDSRDGYPAHPREVEYRSAQLASLDVGRKVVTAACAAAAAPPAPVVEPAPVVVAPAPAPPAAVPATDTWWTGYGSCTKLKQNTVGHPTGPFSRDDPAQAAIYTWFTQGTGHNGDGDGDGLACE